MYTKVSKAKVKLSELHTKNGMKMTAPNLSVLPISAKCT